MITASRLGGWIISASTSSELDDCIRSMYEWYRAAHVCVTYLAETRLLEDMKRDSWFTRGWTLQELLAPHNVRFYDMDWDDMLLKGEHPQELPFFPQAISAADIHDKIHEVTSITEDELMLCRRGEMEQIPISRRLELAADRTHSWDSSELIFLSRTARALSTHSVSCASCSASKSMSSIYPTTDIGSRETSRHRCSHSTRCGHLPVFRYRQILKYPCSLASGTH